MPTEKGMFVLDTDASVVAISGILHQEQVSGHTSPGHTSRENGSPSDSLGPERY